MDSLNGLGYVPHDSLAFLLHISFSVTLYTASKSFLEFIYFFEYCPFTFFFPPHIETSAIFCQTVSDGRGCQNLRCSFVRPFSRLSLFLFLAAISSVPFLFTLVRPPLPPDNFNRLSRVSLFLSRRLCFISPMIFIS